MQACGGAPPEVPCSPHRSSAARGPASHHSQHGTPCDALRSPSGGVAKTAGLGFGHGSATTGGRAARRSRMGLPPGMDESDLAVLSQGLSGRVSVARLALAGLSTNVRHLMCASVLGLLIQGTGPRLRREVSTTWQGAGCWDGRVALTTQDCRASAPAGRVTSISSQGYVARWWVNQDTDSSPCCSPSHAERRGP